MLKLLSVLVLILTFGIGQMWGAGVATLPFAEYDGGDAPTGLTRTGVGAYDTSPKCKFDGTNDVITIQFSDIPYQLKYTIKGNSFSGGTFTVSESADGTNWSTVAEYTTLGSAQNETKDLLTTTRYVRFLYTEKSSGNVALGKISISKLPKYTVSYNVNANNATGSVPTDATLYDPNASVTVKGNTGNLERTGCTFAGWNTKADGTGTNYAADATFSISANTTLYAKWTATVTWKANNVIVKTDDIVVPAAGKTVTLPTDGEIGSNKCGDRIMGWTESENHKANTPPADLFTAAPTVQGSKTYYAVFANYAE